MTNAKNVYDLQQKLDWDEQQMNEIYYATPREQQHLLLDHPQQIAINALRAEVAAAQAEIGGVVYRVHNGNLGRLIEKFEKLNKKAAKYGLDPVAYTVTNETFERVEKNPVTGLVKSVEHFTFVVVKAGKVQIGGWQFIARLDVQEAGVLISKVPAMALVGMAWDNSEKVAEAQAHLDALSLVHLADPSTATDCDHCHRDRRRNATFVLENLDNGEFKQVGSSCLRDFLGVDPGRLAQYAEWLAELDADLNDDDEGGFGSSPREATPTYWYLANVCTMLRTNGWTPRSGGSNATADQASDNVYYQAKGQKDRTGQPMWVDTTEEDVERAKAALAWAVEHIGAKEFKSDFDHNLYIAAQSSVVTRKLEGVLAYLPVAHAKFQEKEIEKRAEKESRLDEFFGQVGARVSLKLKVFSVFESDGYYGVSYITTLRDEAGRPFKWFGSYELDRGETYEATWTIKKHEEHPTYGKATVITRPAKVTKVKNEETTVKKGWR